MRQTKFVDRLRDMDFSGMTCPMAVVYDRPSDFPGWYICRLWDLSRPTDTAIRRETLEAVREDIKAAGFMVKIPRYENDDPVIVETWM